MMEAAVSDYLTYLRFLGQERYAQDAGFIIKQAIRVGNVDAWAREASRNYLEHYQAFVRWCSLVGYTEEGPEGRAMTESDLRKMAGNVPNTVTGLQDRLVIRLLWLNNNLASINKLVVSWQPEDAETAHILAAWMQRRAGWKKEKALFVDETGRKRTIYGQKLNPRLARYAGKPITASTVTLSGRLWRWRQGQ